MNETKKLSSDQVVHDYATALFISDGKYTTRLALGRECDYKIKIAARRNWLTDVFYFLDFYSSKFLGTERKWVKVTLTPSSYLSSNPFIALCQKVSRIFQTNTALLNINSLCKRTNLTRNEVLQKSPDELSKLLANSQNLSWQYSKLSNDLFPHIFFINLKKRTDRVESFEKHLKQIGANLKYERIDAVVGADLPSAEIAKMSNEDDIKRQPWWARLANYLFRCGDRRPGRLGCFKSHLAALEKAKEQGLKEILITEDDIRFIPNYFSSNYVRAAKNELPKDWGILFLGHYDAEKTNAKPYSDHLVQPGCPYDCHAYLINSTMYDTLIHALKAELQKKEPGSIRPLDVVIGEDLVRTGRIFACKENVAVQTNGISSIAGKKMTSNYRRELSRFSPVLFPPKPDIWSADGLPIMKPLLAGTLYQMMHHIDRLFTQYGVQYVIESGTALGAERHQGLIPHDDDIDIQLLPGEEEKLKNDDLRKELKSVGLKIVDHWLGAKVCTIKEHPLGKSLDLDGYRYNTPNVDIFFSENRIINGENAQFYKSDLAQKYWPKLYMTKTEIGKIQRVPFGPCTVNAMEKQREYCFRAYGKDCLSEAYIQRDHINEKERVSVPVAMTDFRAPAWKGWDGIGEIDVYRK